MKAIHPTDITRHNEEIRENLRHWETKPALRAEYARFYRLIAEALAGVPPGDLLECGSGIGNLKSVLPSAITSDLFPNPWLDRVENTYSLSFPDRSLSGIVLFDVFHHLEFPGDALRELARVLRPGGRIVLFEPAVGLLGRLALGLFHHEPLALRAPITWHAPADTDHHSLGYYAAQGNAWRIFVRREPIGALPAELTIHAVRPYAALPWLLTGGFRGPSLFPQWLSGGIHAADYLLNLAPLSFASRLLVVLEKSTSSR